MKKILGLDLGSGSIGWAFIAEPEKEDEKAAILDMGVRIIPLDTDSATQYQKGQAITINQTRTMKRSARKNLDRYQMRRKSLVAALTGLGMMPDKSLFELGTIELYALRHRALREKLSPQEIGRILLHLNQKRGYKSSRKEDAKEALSEAAKTSEYLEAMSSRSRFLHENGITVGQKQYRDFLENLNKNDGLMVSHSIKNEVYPREDYLDEFNKIWSFQRAFYPDLMSESVLIKLRDHIIYKQRPLKSQKGLVSRCEFESRMKEVVKEGKTRKVLVGPRVAARSNPLAQVCKIWEAINTVTFETPGSTVKVEPTLEQKRLMFDFLQNNEKISKAKMLEIMGDKKLRTNAQVEKAGLRGNETLARIKAALLKSGLNHDAVAHLTAFHLASEDLILSPKISKSLEEYQTKSKKKKFTLNNEQIVDTTTGEIVQLKQFRSDIENQPLYKIWHCLHSIDNKKELKHALLEQKSLMDSGLTEAAAEELCKVVFRNDDYASKSCKAIRKILPYLEMGYNYSDACALAGYNHSGSLTNEQNLKRTLFDQLPLLKKGALRQPVVEKVLNQLINLVNAILLAPDLGRPDEIRIELARDLQKNAEQRNKAYSELNKRTKENDEIAAELQSRYGLTPTAHRIKKWRVWHETGGQSLYTGKKIGLAEFLNANSVDIEHIIPQSVLFDNSTNNWTICEREENIKKGASTALEWMETKGRDALEEYVKRVNYFYEEYIRKDNKEKAIYRPGINKRKRDYLLMKLDEIPQDFVTRQLNETRYITKKAKALLETVCYKVQVTSGVITDYLRHHWGYDNVLHDINLERYRDAGLVRINESGNERIIDWSKRFDHRHHAIDALIVAVTQPAIIQLLNNLNQRKNNIQLKEFNEEGLKKKIQNYKHFDTNDVRQKVERIIVSIKQGKKLVTRKKNKHGNVTLVPRGPLHDESVYGIVRRIAKKAVKVNAKLDLETIQQIVNPSYQSLLKARLEQANGDAKKAFGDIKKNSIWLDENEKIALEEVKVFEFATVKKYTLNEQFKEKDCEFIVDGAIKELVKNRFISDGNAAMKGLKEKPILFNGKAVNSVRCYAELTKFRPLKKALETGFVNPGNNHHVTLCRDEDGKPYELEIVPFWEALERIKEGRAVYSNPTESNHTRLVSIEGNEVFECPEQPQSKRFFRAQKITSGNYWFMNINNTERDETLIGKKAGISILCSPSSFNLKKVRVDILGRIKP